MRSLLAPVVALAVAVHAAPAHATDTWTAPYPGVQHLHRSEGPFDYHVLVIDLRNPRLQFVTTPERATLPRARDRRPRHHWTRTTTFADATGADIAINANYYDIFHAKHSVCGLTVSGGKRWRSTYQDERLSCDDSVGFGPHGLAAVFDSRNLESDTPPFAWMTDVVTGSPRLLRDGVVLHYRHPRHAIFRNPRTAVGLSRDRGTLYLMVVNGREGRAQGMTCVETASALKELGAWDAVNLDGGGSSALFVRSESGLVSHSADGVERAVGNHLGIAFRDPPRSVEVSLPPASERAVEASPAPQRPRLARGVVAAGAAPRPTRGWSLPVVAGSLGIAVAGFLRRRKRLGV